MASYITITDAETDPEAPLTSELAKKWRDNPLAIAEGAVGAPRVQTAGLNDAAVTRVKLSTGTNSASYSAGGSGGSGTITLDAYSFFPQTTNAISFGGGSSADTPTLSWSLGGSGSGTVRWRYILA